MNDKGGQPRQHMPDNHLETENLLFNGHFDHVLPFHKGNRPAAWVVSARGSARVKPWKGSSRFRGETWAEGKIEYRMHAASGLHLYTGSQGAGTFFYQNIPAYRLRQNDNAFISVQGRFNCTNADVLRLAVRFTVSVSGKDTCDLDEMSTPLNPDTTGALTLEGIPIPDNCLYARVAFHMEADDCDAFFFQVEAVNHATIVRTRPFHPPLSGIGLPRIAQKIWAGQDITVVATGDSITEICSGEDGVNNDGDNFLHQFTSHIQAIAGDNLTVRQFRNGNAGGQDVDILVQSDDKLIHRADGLVPDLILFTCGRNEWRTDNDDLCPHAPKGVGMFRFSCLEALVRKVRAAHPDSDLVFMVPCPRPLSDTLPTHDDVDDDLWIRQNETLARTYGGSVVYPESAFHDLANKGHIAAQHLWEDGIHPYKPGQTLIAQHLIDFFNQALFDVKPAFKPDVSTVRPMGSLTRVLENARRWRMGSPFSHNDFTPMGPTSFAAGGIKIDGITEFFGMIGEKDGDAIEFTDIFHHYLFIHVLEFIDAGKLDLYIDGDFIETMDCRHDHYDFLWFGAMNTKRTFSMSPGRHTVRIVQNGDARAGIWYIGVL